jgi:hypothetical protein
MEDQVSSPLPTTSWRSTPNGTVPCMPKIPAKLEKDPKIRYYQDYIETHMEDYQNCMEEQVSRPPLTITGGSLSAEKAMMYAQMREQRYQDRMAFALEQVEYYQDRLTDYIWRAAPSVEAVKQCNQLILALPIKITDYISLGYMPLENEVYYRIPEVDRNLKCLYDKVITDLLQQGSAVSHRLFTEGSYSYKRCARSLCKATFTFNQSYSPEELESLAVELMEAIENITDSKGVALSNRIENCVFYQIPKIHFELQNKEGKARNTVKKEMQKEHKDIYFRFRSSEDMRR